MENNEEKTENNEEKMELKGEQTEASEPSWKVFLRNHWTFVVVAAGAIAIAIVGAIFVFLGVVDWALATGLVPATLGAWTVGYCVTFFLNVLLYEFLIIGLPIIGGVICGYLWYRNLPAEERAEYEKDSKKKKSSGGSGAISFLVTIVWLIVVYANNMWNTAFNLWTLNYLITSILWAFGLVLLIGGIPLAIGGIWWLTKQLKEPAKESA